ncbi:hypothetical protein [Streptomyces roseochromogenus]|uniref:Uncharacterized protein n=1 Tax=Streptomyces roseochromogenus subsp. oscitans DS 12.976 TaxID=1352936 RepID=V6JFW2_STRRC|nr:hypothetical protein [Streptomyces roseochromogenus]EST18061.1 hypothetical protein M878_45700 [Streptomyces roseochromogenus subsp. oscitans DS 12.976]
MTATATMPTTADSIRAAVIAHQTPWTETELERLILEQNVDMGTPAVRIQCRKDTKTGRRITAIIASGIRTMTGQFLPAHDAIIQTFARVDGRLDAATNARRVLARRLALPADLPVSWENKPGRSC